MLFFFSLNTLKKRRKFFSVQDFIYNSFHTCPPTNTHTRTHEHHHGWQLQTRCLDFRRLLEERKHSKQFVCVCVSAFILLFWEQNYLYRTLVVWKGVFAVVVCYLLDLKLGQRLWSSVCALVSANVSVCAPALGELSFVKN